MEYEQDLIIGIHSIKAALENPKRANIKLYCAEESKEDLIKKKLLHKSHFEGIACELMSIHKLQEKAKEFYSKLGLDYQRVPSNLFLVSGSAVIEDVAALYDRVSHHSGLKILCLDQVTDVHNAAAIARTASFYGVNIIVVPSKNTFRMTPSFYRIASGASEFVSFVGAANLSKTISKLQEKGVRCIGLSEHAKETFSFSDLQNENVCLVLGKEDTGLSNAVLRTVQYTFALHSQGNIQSLNVSVAAAVALEKCWGRN